MAKLIINNMDIIECHIKNINDGKIDKPIDSRKYGKTKNILNGLEKIRKTIVKLENEKLETKEYCNTMVANITHDLKTPLALISGFAESIQDGMEDKDYLSLILEKTKFMNELVLKIIENTKKEISEIKHMRSTIKADSFFSNEIKKYVTLANAKNIKIKTKKIPDIDIYIVKEDYARVLQNLITNSINFGKEKGKIKVKFSKRKKMLFVRIVDNGIGIAKENIPYIFDKFYKEDKSRTLSNSGVGLSIVKTIIEDNGGEIFCKSKKDKGTKFVFSLPIEKKAEKKKIYTKKNNVSDGNENKDNKL